MTSATKCRAQNPETCTDPNCPELRSHRAAVTSRMDAARESFDFKAYGEAYTELQILEGKVQRAAVRVPAEESAELVSDLIGRALDLTADGRKSSRREIAAIYALVPNEVVGETMMTLLKGRKNIVSAVGDAKNPYMYRVLAANIRQYSVTAKLCMQIIESGDHRARLLLASHLKNDARVIQNSVTVSSRDVLAALAKDSDPEIRAYLARTKELYPYNQGTQLTRELREDHSAEVRLALAQNERLSLDDAEVLAQDADARVAAEAKPVAERLREVARERAEAEASAQARYDADFKSKSLPRWEVEEMSDEEYDEYINQ